MENTFKYIEVRMSFADNPGVGLTLYKTQNWDSNENVQVSFSLVRWQARNV